MDTNVFKHENCTTLNHHCDASEMVRPGVDRIAKSVAEVHESLHEIAQTQFAPENIRMFSEHISKNTISVLASFRLP